MRIIILLITILISSQTFVTAGDRKIDSIPEEMRTLRKEKYNDVWNDFVLSYAKFVDERNSWQHCTNVTGFKPEGIYRRLVVCYTEEEGNLLQKHNLMVDNRIHAVMERSVKRLWDSADGVDYALIMQKSDSFLNSASKTMFHNRDHWEDVALPKVLMEVFNELNEEDKAKKIALKKSITKPKKIIKKKSNKISSKSLLKKLLGANQKVMGAIVRGIAEGIENSLGIPIEYSLIIGVVIAFVAFYFILK